ncbi:MAG TPA: GNAT family N-acetyltransferase, partial [Chloroflexota bacterium]|nr:GNAT family N-acetyltransferase [Chloroflexota bacterium]
LVAGDVEALSGLLLRELPRFYDDVDHSFPASLAAASAAERDEVGYFTIQKLIYIARHGGTPIGFTVASRKRGGSVKIGPTAVMAEWRGQGVATHLRDEAEQRLFADRGARKLYLTVPANNLPALLFNLNRGFCIEAVLTDQYQEGRTELVMGRTEMRPPRAADRALNLRHAPGKVRTEMISDPPLEALVQTFLEPLRQLFDGIDISFFRSITEACKPERQSYAAKGKRAIVGYYEEVPDALCVYTPKRGGAVKLGPLVGRHVGAVESVLQAAYECAKAEGRRKLYAHLPSPCWDMIKLLGRRGFVIEGQLREPYKPGVDVLVHGLTL